MIQTHQIEDDERFSRIMRQDGHATHGRRAHAAAAAIALLMDQWACEKPAGLSPRECLRDVEGAIGILRAYADAVSADPGMTKLPAVLKPDDCGFYYCECRCPRCGSRKRTDRGSQEHENGPALYYTCDVCGCEYEEFLAQQYANTMIQADSPVDLEVKHVLAIAEDRGVSIDKLYGNAGADEEFMVKGFNRFVAKPSERLELSEKSDNETMLFKLVVD